MAIGLRVTHRNKNPRLWVAWSALMSETRIAAFSVHTSPLARPGRGDGGGMNVYLRSLLAALSKAGVACDVFTRRSDPDEPEIVELEPGIRVVHVDAGPLGPLEKELQAQVLDEFTDRTREFMERSAVSYSALHAHYWLSGVVARAAERLRRSPRTAAMTTGAAVGGTRATST